MGDSYKNYESFYTGGMSSFSNNYGASKDNTATFTGYHASASNLGFPGSTQTANQLTEAVKAIKQGVKAFEVTMGVADTAEQIPKQNFAEMRALMKLTGVRPSVHAPFTIDASGFDQQKGYSDENGRLDAERRFFNVMQKAKELNNEDNVPVVFHSSGGVPGFEYRPGEDGEKFHAVKGAIVNRETGEIKGIEEDKLFRQGMNPKDFAKGGHTFTVEDRIESQNETAWSQQITGLNNNKIQADIMIDRIAKNPTMLELEKLPNIDMENLAIFKEQNPEIASSVDEAKMSADQVSNILDSIRLNFNNSFHTAYKYGTDAQKEELKNLSNGWARQVMAIRQNHNLISINREMSNLIDKNISELSRITNRERDPKPGEIIGGAPEIFVNVEDYAKEKASETFGNLAWRSYKELGGNKAPMIAIENMYSGMAFSRAEDLKGLIDESRKKFIEKAKKDGMGTGEAEEMASKLIGATWDVGHLNILKKQGYKDEDIIEETKKIASYVKHVHLTDNFGFSDSHLAPGMGNVPIKQILEQLEKQGKLSEMSKIVEAPGFVQHFQRSPHGWTMAALGSPIYGAMMGPYWNQVAGATAGGGYFGGPIAYMPEKHFSTYGSGFSSLPSELGGQMPGTASRFSGAPNT